MRKAPMRRITALFFGVAAFDRYLNGRRSCGWLRRGGITTGDGACRRTSPVRIRARLRAAYRARTSVAV